MAGLKLNLGCGSQVVDGWVNVDYAIGARLAKIPVFSPINRRLKLLRLDWSPRIFLHDLRQPLPWPDCSAEVVYSSHTLEHLTKTEGLALLRECHRVLRPDGTIRLVVPDLARIVNEYVSGRMAAEDFVAALGVLPEYKGRGPKVLQRRFQNHACMYDPARLLAILDDIGFDARERGSLDSEIDDIARVELEERAEGSLVVEGRKRRETTT